MRKVEGILTDEDIEKELARLRDRNLTATLASKEIERRTRQENKLCRKRYETAHQNRMIQEYKNSLAHLKVFGNMYDNSPFRTDVAAQYKRWEKRVRSEKRQDAIYDATYKTLDNMTGEAEDFIVKWADKDALDRIMASPMNREVLKHKQTYLDLETVRDEFTELGCMVKLEMDVCMDKFPVLEQKLGMQKRAREAVDRPTTMEFARAQLQALSPVAVKERASRTDTTTTSNNDPASAGTPLGSTLSESGTASLEQLVHDSVQDPTLLEINQMVKQSHKHEFHEARHHLHHGSPIAHVPGHHHGIKLAHNLNDPLNATKIYGVEREEHHDVHAGAAYIVKVGSDGMKHKVKQNLEELEGKIDHHLHHEAGSFSSSDAGVQQFTHHKTTGTKGIKL